MTWVTKVANNDYDFDHSTSTSLTTYTTYPTLKGWLTDLLPKIVPLYYIPSLELGQVDKGGNGGKDGKGRGCSEVM